MTGAAPKPIFVIGLNRSGTKWLSNELSRHSQVACVKNENTGIRETNMFRGMGRKFDLNHLDDYIGMIELWSTTDFFVRTGVEKTIFYSDGPPVTDPYLLLARLMDAFALREGKAYWLLKGPPIAGLELFDRFPTAHYVIIRRNIVDQIQSNIARFSRPKFSVIARAAFGNIRDNRILDHFQRSLKCPTVNYEDLKRNPATVIQELFEKWDIPAGMIDTSATYRHNTSFLEEPSRKEYFNSSHRLWIHICAIVARLIPFSVMLYFARKRWEQMGPLVAGTFSNVYERYHNLRKC